MQESCPLGMKDYCCSSLSDLTDGSQHLRLTGKTSLAITKPPAVLTNLSTIYDNTTVLSVRLNEGFDCAAMSVET